MPRVTRAELSRHLGVSKKTVTVAVQSGRITLGDDGKCDLAVAESQYKGETPGPRDTDADTPGDVVSSQEARRRKDLAQAELAEIKAKVMRGDLLDRVTVEAEWFTLLRTLRDRMLGVPDRLAILVAAESDEHRVRLMLDAEIRESLTIVAGTLDPGASDP